MIIKNKNKTKENENDELSQGRRLAIARKLIFRYKENITSREEMEQAACFNHPGS